MKLFGFSITRGAQPPIKKELSPAAAAWLAGGDPEPRGPLLDNPYTQIAWVYRAVNVLAEQIANIPFLFSRGERGRENLITSGPLHDFYDQPHPYINRFQYWELRVLWLLLRGECFRIPIFDDAALVPPSPRGEGRGEGEFRSRTLDSSSPPTHPLRASPARTSPTYPSPSPRRTLKHVLILNPDHFHEVIEDHRLIGWRYTGLGSKVPLESQVFLPEEVWHDKLPNPFNFWRGLSPLCSADLALRTDYAAGAFMFGYMENNADNGLIVRTADHLDDMQKEQIVAALRNRKRRAGAADKPLLLWNSAEVIKPQLSAADLQFLENRKFSRSEICAALGIPEEIVATTDHNKYDVMQGARLNFIENRVAPFCARLEAAENLTTIPAIVHSSGGSASQIANQKSKIENPIGWFDLDSLPIMQQARRNRLAAAKTGFDMGVPFNELNRLLDLGLPDLPHGNTCYLPKTLREVGSSLAAPNSDAAIPPATNGNGPTPSPEELLQLSRTVRDLVRRV